MKRNRIETTKSYVRWAELIVEFTFNFFIRISVILRNRAYDNAEKVSPVQQSLLAYTTYQKNDIRYFYGRLNKALQSLRNVIFINRGVVIHSYMNEMSENILLFSFLILFYFHKIFIILHIWDSIYFSNNLKLMQNKELNTTASLWL